MKPVSRTFLHRTTASSLCSAQVVGLHLFCLRRSCLRNLLCSKTCLHQIKLQFQATFCFPCLHKTPTDMNKTSVYIMLCNKQHSKQNLCKAFSLFWATNLSSYLQNIDVSRCPSLLSFLKYAEMIGTVATDCRNTEDFLIALVPPPGCHQRCPHWTQLQAYPCTLHVACS